jgi:hypothetical protein
MLALELNNTKDFMNKLLASEIFDHFLLQEAVITAAASYVIDGKITKGYFSDEEKEKFGIRECTFLPYSMLRQKCFDLIKGKKTPASFKFVLMLSPENLKRTLESIKSGFGPDDITGVFINIRYQNQLLTLTTGVSYRTFSTDRTLDTEWDKMVQIFLRQHDIEFGEL